MKSKNWPDDYRLTFGKHKGETLDEVPLKYLDWLLGQEWLFDDARKAISAYLKQPGNARALDRELEAEE